jgi:hypothetical protein
MKRNTAVQVELVESEQVEQVEADGLETIGELAREGFGPVDVLMREFAGLVCVPGVAARDLLAARAAAEEEQRAQRRRRAEERARRRPRRARGVPALPEMSAYESMIAASGEDDAKKDRAGERLASLLRGESTGGRFSPGEKR